MDLFTKMNAVHDLLKEPRPARTTVGGQAVGAAHRNHRDGQEYSMPLNITQIDAFTDSRSRAIRRPFGCRNVVRHPDAGGRAR
jgi:hypothetical protein